MTLLNVFSRLLVINDSIRLLLVHMHDRMTNHFILVDILNYFGLRHLNFARWDLLKLGLIFVGSNHDWLRVESLTRWSLSLFRVDWHELVQLIKPRSPILTLRLAALSILGISFPFFDQISRGIQVARCNMQLLIRLELATC